MDALTATAIGASAVVIIGAVTKSVIDIMKEVKNLRSEVKQVHAAVNGSNTVLIESNARLTAKLAELTGEVGDRREADVAEATAKSKRGVVAVIGLNDPKKEAI